MTCGQKHALNAKLNEKDPKFFYRLPTEAEWELAARSGPTTAYSYGDHPAKLSEYAHFIDNGGGRTHAVGMKKPNPAGLTSIFALLTVFEGSGWLKIKGG